LRKKKRGSKPKEADRLIYCGPSIPTLSLQKYAVFNNGTPDSFQKTFGECGAIKKLFLPVEKFPHFQKKVIEAGSAEYYLFNQVSKYVRSEKE
jgi:hypothetical protein